MKRMRDTRFKPGVSGDHHHVETRPVGQSGVKKSKRGDQFEEEFNEALITGVGPDEAAKLLWEAARFKQPMSIQELCRRKVPFLMQKALCGTGN
jgi:hypothetical protein